MLASGLMTYLPTATNGLGSGQWKLGPGLLIVKLTPKWVLDLFPNHQRDIESWTLTNNEGNML